MWYNSWMIKEAVKPMMYSLMVLGVGIWGLWLFAKITYKMHMRKLKNK